MMELQWTVVHFYPQSIPVFIHPHDYTSIESRRKQQNNFIEKDASVLTCRLQFLRSHILQNTRYLHGSLRLWNLLTTTKKPVNKSEGLKHKPFECLPHMRPEILGTGTRRHQVGIVRRSRRQLGLPLDWKQFLSSCFRVLLP